MCIRDRVRSDWRSVCFASLLFSCSLALMGLLTYLYPELIFSPVSPDQVSEMERCLLYTSRRDIRQRKPATR